MNYAASSMCGSLFSHLGWKLYMEDVYIAISPFTHKNFSLFGVFDGYGGTHSLIIKAVSLPFLWKDISHMNYQKMKVLGKDSTK